MTDHGKKLPRRGRAAGMGERAKKRENAFKDLLRREAIDVKIGDLNDKIMNNLQSQIELLEKRINKGRGRQKRPPTRMRQGKKGERGA